VHPGQTSAASGTLLPNHELVRSAKEDFRRQVPAHFTAKATLNGDGLKRELPQAGRHVAAAFLALHDERLAA
jgi:hypothetical protein